jgi:hypothetical protein
MKNFEDISESTNLDRETVIAQMKELENHKEELCAALARHYFLKCNGKNIIVTLRNGVKQCIICRGNIFYVYEENSNYVKPYQYTYQEVIENFEESMADIEDVKETQYVNNKEATAFIREIYLKRATEEKALLKQILDYTE